MIMNRKPIYISNPMTKRAHYKMVIKLLLEDIEDYESCKEHANMNVLENPSYFCYACKRDTLLSVQLRGLADLFRDTEMQRERAEDCIKALKQELEK